jgi:hypothetical protein
MKKNFLMTPQNILGKTRANSVKIKNLRVSKTSKISLSNYTTYLIKEKILKIKQSISSYHVNNIKKSNELVLNTQKSLSKKNIISSLKDDLDYHKKINENYLAYEKYAEDLYKCYKKNYEDISIYKNDLTEDLKDFIELMKEYDENQKALFKEKKLIIQSNEDIIKFKLEEQKNLEKKISKLNEDLDKQNISLKDLNAILKLNMSLNQNNYLNLQNEELKYKEKLETLENAYKKLIHKYNYYQDMTTLEYKKKFANENLNKSEEANEASIKLKEESIKNNYLKNQIDAIKNKMKEFDNLNNSKMKKFKYKLNRDITTDDKTVYTKFTDSTFNFSSNNFSP